MLVFSTTFSVLVLSLMLGFSSGFHLYIFTAPIFIFWLFNNQRLVHVILTFFVYIGLYIFTLYSDHHYFPMYEVHVRFLGLTLYDFNALLNILLIFLLFYSYFLYHTLLTSDLLDKQKKLETEIMMRKESEANTKKLFDDLSLSYKNLEQFSFVVSHNMRAPLANIKGFISLFEKSRPGTEQNSQIVNYVETAANHLDDILSDLNYILRNRQSALENKEELDFKKTVREIAHSLGKEITATEANVRSECEVDATIYTIKSALTNILYNLIQNAIKYRKSIESPIIEISLDCQDFHFYCIKVKDNGIGIDLSKHKDRVFKLYSRLNNNIEGKGIGLYLVKTQVEVLGGEIEIDSEVSKGTTFTIKLPK